MTGTALPVKLPPPSEQGDKGEVLVLLHPRLLACCYGPLVCLA